MKLLTSGIALALVLFQSAFTFAETVKDREGAVRQDKAARENDPRWIYNDVERGFAEARKANKPLLVVLRCVPCLACAGIDAEVLEEGPLQPLLDRFVRVRLINANALDLARFQFDYDLSFSTLFFNGDGTVYARYGSWRHQKDPQDKTTASFKKTLESVLAAHRAYPSNRASLAGKQGVPLPFKTPLEMPKLAGKYGRELDWEGKVVQSCVHCHQIGDAMRFHFREKKEPIPEEWIYPQPMPETIGLTLAADDIARIERVQPGSSAEKAGLKPGDAISLLNGHSILSAADLSWALHRTTAAPATVDVEYQRAGRTAAAKIELPAGWRTSSDISRRVGTWPMRAMAFGGLVLEDLGDEERAHRGLDPAGLAMFVKHVGQYNEHAAAKRAGFQKEDVLIEVDGITKRMTEGALLGHILRNHPRGKRLKAVVLRGTQRLNLELPVQ